MRRRQLESLLTALLAGGGLGGATPDEAFDVRCDRTTMTQADLDAGRLIAKITVLPGRRRGTHHRHPRAVLRTASLGDVREGGVMAGADRQERELPENQLAAVHMSSASR